MKRFVTALLVVLVAGQTLWASNPLTHYKSGISLTLAGTQDVDWAFERLYHDPLIDDRGVIYIKAATQISLAHNAMNRYDAAGVVGVNGPDGVPDSGDEGIIRYKVDMDWNWRYSWSDLRSAGDRTEAQKCPRYSGPLSFATLQYYDGVAVLGATGPLQAVPPYPSQGTQTFYWRGLTDEVGDQWHIITVGDDDTGLVGFYDHWSSDGKIFLFVVNPLTPCISFSKLNADAEWHTTPPKAYFVPKIHAQTSYVTSGVAVEFTNVTDAQPVRFRIDEIDGSTWRTYAGPVDLATLGLVDDTAYTLRYRNGDAGAEKVRMLHYNPSFPSDAEQHPSKVLWKNSRDEQRIRDLIQNNATYTGNFNQLLGQFRGGHGVYAQPLMTGSRLVDCNVYPANNAFTVYIDGFGAHGLQEQLAHDYTIDNCLNLDPIGHERSHNDANPCRERVYHGYYFVARPMAVALAYDLLIKTFRKPTHAGGFTAVEDYRIRDMLGSFAATVMQLRTSGWPNRSAVPNWDVPNGYYAGMWGTAREIGLQIIAMILPTYDTPYYGTSGADGRPATHLWTPYPDMALSWWESVNSKELGSGIYHLVTDEAVPRWQDRPGYWGGAMMGWLFYALSNARANFDGHHWPHLEAAYQLAMDGQFKALKLSGGDPQYIHLYTCQVVNENFADLAQQAYDTLSAGTSVYEENLSYSMWLRGVHGLCNCRTDWQQYLVTGPAIAGWAAASSHGPAGQVAVEAADGYVEPRSAGVAAFRLTFDAPLDPATVAAGVIAITGQTQGDLSARVSSITLENADTVMVVALGEPLRDVDRYTVTLADSVKGLGGLDVEGDRSLSLGVLPGDVNSSGLVTLADVLAVRASGGLLGPATARLDVDCSGSVSGSDLLAVRAALGQSLP